jgi:hypothetical protein
LTFRVVFSAARGQLGALLEGLNKPIAEAATGAITDAAASFTTKGRAAIAGAGFGPKWQNALRVIVYPTGRASIDAAMYAYHKIRYAGVFETGATITGKPFMWLPIAALPDKFGSQRVTPKVYRETVGPLHTVRARGKLPMLAGPVKVGRPGSKLTLSKLRAGQAGGKGVETIPLFVGIKVVHEPAKLGLAAVFNEVKGDLPADFARRLGS